MTRGSRSVAATVVRGIKSVLDVAYWPKLVRERDSFERTEDWSALVARICRHRGRRSIFANQHPAEIGAVCEQVRQLQPRVIVEIGTSQGGTLYLWSRIVQPGGLVISIDKPGEPGSVRPVMRAVYRTFGRERGARVITLDRDSHSPQTHAELERLLAGRPIDFLFIDGDHSYAGVKADFHAYRRLVAPHGLIAMHDVAHSASHPTIQVPRFWNELASEPLDRTVVVAEPNRSPGIGLVRQSAAAGTGRQVA